MPFHGLRLGVPGGSDLIRAAGGGLSSYTGQLANNCLVANDKQTFGATSQMEAGSFHIARSRITAMSVAVPTWWVVHGTGLESGIGGTATVTLKLEYPVGTEIGTFTWSGQSPATLPDNSNNFSDLMTGLNIPKGATFGLHLFWQSANGFVLRNGNNTASPVIYNKSRDAVRGEKYRQAASGLTMAATISAIPSSDSNVGQTGWHPAAIVGPTVEPSIFLLGDSRGEGYHDQYDDGSFDIGYARCFGNNFGYINASKFARDTSQYISSHDRQNELASYCSHIAFELGYNDISAAAGTVTTFLANQQTIIGYFPGKPIFCLTVPPGATSTDGFLTSGNQAQLSKVPNLQSYNAMLRAGTIAGVTGYFDFARTADPADAGIWNPTTSPISAVYTASQAAAVFTVSAVSSGALAPYDMISSTDGALPAAQLLKFGIGIGGKDISGLNAGGYTPVVSVNANGSSFTNNFGASAFAQSVPSGYSAYGSSVTFDPAHKGTVTLSNANLTATGSTTNWNNAFGTTYVSSGKYYLESTVVASNAVDLVGIANASAATGGAAGYPGFDLNGLGWANDGRVLVNNSNTGSIGTWTTGAVLSQAIDKDNNLWWGRVGNGNWNNSATANPTGGSGSTGPYTSSKNGTIASKTFFSNAPTVDGVHEFSKMLGIYKTAGIVNPAVIHR